MAKLIIDNHFIDILSSNISTNRRHVYTGVYNHSGYTPISQMLVDVDIIIPGTIYNHNIISKIFQSYRSESFTRDYKQNMYIIDKDCILLGNSYITNFSLGDNQYGQTISLTIQPDYVEYDAKYPVNILRTKKIRKILSKPDLDYATDV